MAVSSFIDDTAAFVNRLDNVGIGQLTFEHQVDMAIEQCFQRFDEREVAVGDTGAV